MEQMTLKAGTTSCVFFQTGDSQYPDGLMDRWHSKLGHLLVSSSRQVTLNILMALMDRPWWTGDTQSWDIFLCLLPDRWHSILWVSLLLVSPKQIGLQVWVLFLVSLNTLCLVSLGPETLKDWMFLMVSCVLKIRNTLCGSVSLLVSRSFKTRNGCSLRCLVSSR